MNRMTLTVPAQEDWAIVVRSALNGVGVLANLSADMLDDLRTAVDEAYDLLMSQPRKVEHIRLVCEIKNDALHLHIQAERAPSFQQCAPADPEVARLIIGTLVTEAHLEGDSCVINGEKMTLPANVNG